MLFCLANPFAQRHSLSARVLTEKFSFPPFLILTLLISFAKPLWLWMYSSIYTDWQWPSKRTLTLLPLSLLGSRCLSFCCYLVVCLIPSDFIAACLWFEALFFICIFFLSACFYLPLSIPHLSWMLSSKLSKNIPSKKLLLTTVSAGKLMQTHMHLKIVGARTITHSPC